MNQQSETARSRSPASQALAVLRLCGKWLLRLALLGLIALAACLVLGRLSMALLPSQKDAVEEQLSDLFGARVGIAEIHGDWFRFAPIIAVHGLQIGSLDRAGQAQDQSLVIDEFNIRPNIVASLLERSLIIKQIIVAEPAILLQEDAAGRWSLAGFQGSNDYGEETLDFLLAVERLQVSEAHLLLQRRDGALIALNNAYIDLSNAGGRREWQLQAHLNGQPSPLQAVMRLHGDPRESFSASGYLRMNEADLSPLLPIGENFPTMDRAQLSGRFWWSFEEGQIQDFQADLRDVHLIGQGQQGLLAELAFSNGSFAASGFRGADDSWRLALQDISFDWRNRPWELGDLFAELRPEGEALNLLASSPRLELALAEDILDDALNLPPQGQDTLANLNSAGAFVNLQVRGNLKDFQATWEVATNLEEVALGNWADGAEGPGGSGINGYLQGNRRQGLLELDSSRFMLLMPQMFSDRWEYDVAKGRVRWRMRDGMVHVNSGLFDLQNEFLHSRVQFDLLDTRDTAGQRQSELTLLVGVLEMDASHKSRYLPALDKIMQTMNWLEDAVLAGELSSSGLVSRGSALRVPPHNSGTVQTFVNMKDGALKFLPRWPELVNMDAYVKVNDYVADVFASSFQIKGLPFRKAVARVSPNPAGGSWVAVTGDSLTTIPTGLDFLKTTPARENLGNFIDSWGGEGEIDLAVQLGVPLNNPSLKTAVRVSGMSNDITLVIPDYDLTLEELEGRIDYDSAGGGLKAEDLSARLFGFPVSAALEPLRLASVPPDEIAGTRILTRGRVSQPALQNWPGHAELVRKALNAARGEFDYQADLLLYNSAWTEGATGALSLNSDLQGLAVELPHPFAKEAAESRPLALQIDFRRTGQRVGARLGDEVDAQFTISEAGLEGGRLAFGPVAEAIGGEAGEAALERSEPLDGGDPLPAGARPTSMDAGRRSEALDGGDPLPTAPGEAGGADAADAADLAGGGLSIMGRLDYFDLEAWMQARDRFFSQDAAAANDESGSKAPASASGAANASSDGLTLASGGSAVVASGSGAASTSGGGASLASSSGAAGASADSVVAASGGSAATASGGPGLLANIAGLDVDIGHLKVMGQDLLEVSTQAHRRMDDERGGAWEITLENPMLNGSFRFPDDEAQAIDIDLAWLRFPEAAEVAQAANDEEEGHDLSATADLGQADDLEPAEVPKPAGSAEAEQAEVLTQAGDVEQAEVLTQGGGAEPAEVLTQGGDTEQAEASNQAGGTEPAEEKADLLAGVDPGALPDMDFAIAELSIGDKNLGAWGFDLRASGGGATLSDFKMTTEEAQVRDLAGEGGANLDWRYDDGIHTSSFKGLFRAGNLASVLPSWGYDANIESESAAFAGNLQWSGSPAAFALENVEGGIEIHIRDGRFVEIDADTTRLFAVLNFDSIVRRLQLDFSDLYKDGMAYDDINGKLNFNRGLVATDGEFSISGPSSEITVDGEMDLVNKTINADLLVNLPLTQNLAMLAGIMGAWPLAVGTYLTGRIFENQVDELTTVLYRLEGPWEDLESGFEPLEAEAPTEELEPAAEAPPEELEPAPEVSPEELEPEPDAPTTEELDPKPEAAEELDPEPEVPTKELESDPEAPTEGLGPEAETPAGGLEPKLGASAEELDPEPAPESP